MPGTAGETPTLPGKKIRAQGTEPGGVALDSRANSEQIAMMESESFDRSLRAFCRRMPFQPFTVELLSGTRFRVEHPEALAFNGGMAVYIATNGTPSLFDHLSVSQLIGVADPKSAQAA